MLRPLILAPALALTLAAPAAAQEIIEPFAPNGEVTRVSGPYARYQRHVLKLSANLYAVLFEPGFVDAATAVAAVAPLCGAARAKAVGDIAPVDLVIEHGEVEVLQGYRVVCE